MDLVYLTNPKMVLLSNVTLEKQNGQYDLSGTSQDGNMQTYRLNKDTWDALEDQWSKEEDAFAQLKILPKTQIVMQISVNDQLAQSSVEKLAMSSRLSDNWQDMELQIDNMVYRIHDPLSSLTERGWKIQQTTYQAKKHQNLDAGKTLTLELENKNGLQMQVTVKNTTDQTQETTQAVITDLVVHRMNQGMHMMLADQLVLGWSSQEAVEESYGKPSKENEEQVVYEQDNKKLILVFSTQGILDEIHMSLPA